MSTPLPPDLTRWNRAGLTRVQYVDGNAAVFLERLRGQLAEAFPGWGTPQATPPAAAEESARKAFLEGVYRQNPDDLLWHLMRAHARAAHVLAGTLDAYANEGWIGTATQWESVRRLVAMLDYAPHPPGSASTALALLHKPGTAAGKVLAGLQVKYAPPDGRPPVVFETLADLGADPALDTLFALDHDRNPAPLAGTTFVLDGEHDALKLGEPLVFEREGDGLLSAHVLTGLLSVVDAGGKSATQVTIAPPLAHAAGFVVGRTWVHAEPKEGLKLIGPVASAAGVDRALELADGCGDLAAGEIVAIGRLGAKPFYRRLKRVSPQRLVLHEPLGTLDLLHAFVGRPVTVPISRLQGGRGQAADGRRLQALQVAGDWRWLYGQWLADVRKVEGREVLPVYECIRAEYTPVSGQKDAEASKAAGEGCTTIGLAWEAATDRVVLTPWGEPQLDLVNPQALLAPPRAITTVRPDPFLQESVDSRLLEPLVGAVPKKISAGDLAVVQRGHRVAWGRLGGVASDASAGEARFTTAEGFTDRGGAPFFLHGTKLFGHFGTTTRLSGWQRNDTPLSGSVVALEALPATLAAGRTVIASNGQAAVRTRVKLVSAPGTAPSVTLRDPLPARTTAASLVLYGNVVDAGHGQTRAARVLGSGDGTRSHQAFVLAVADASFVADSAMPSGVRADLQVEVAGERWTQVARLNESGPTDAHYQVRQQEDGTLRIAFGDGTHGRRLPTGANNVRVTYRQDNGPAGNLAPFSLAKLARPHPQVAAAVQPIAATGGGERESTDAMRTNAAGTLLALERAVSLTDFSYLARSRSDVAQAQAFALPPGRGQRERLELRVIPAGGGKFTPDLGQRVKDFLMAHAMPGVDVNVLSYVPLIVGLQVVVRVRTDAFDGDTVIANVRTALIAAFGIAQRRLGQPLFSGEVFAVVEAVQGVENSDCALLIAPAIAALAERISRNADGGIVAIRPQPEQCAHVDPRQPAVTVTFQPYQL
ncbi:MAG TPA: hypothetical protein VFY73_27840 [Ideonella sp.]|uniref:hypothetical protein n=1 Tax=Ideonella sp. TaxID=1929293 RepID=UPI002E32CC1E|nr:hypothetical protein [Ideonella sp.]HEX5687845.1 hypothetical protein [Ideonella sp.]